MSDPQVDPAKTAGNLSPDRRPGQATEPLGDIIEGLNGGDNAYISLAAAAKLIPSNRPGKRTNVTTLTRWVLEGVLARNLARKGERIRLRAVCRPGGWLTSKEWVAEFLAALTADRAGQPAETPPPVRTSSARRKAAERADRELERLGV